MVAWRGLSRELSARCKGRALLSPPPSLPLALAPAQGKVRDLGYIRETGRVAALYTGGCIKLLDPRRDLFNLRTVSGCGGGWVRGAVGRVVV